MSRQLGCHLRQEHRTTTDEIDETLKPCHKNRSAVIQISELGAIYTKQEFRNKAGKPLY